ncbi:14894_t:CDS:2 [Funneliformis caledonium]|uniref:14894_t:CDS:1 n=1 Tax=Funneliformis caledonium TaxID=1117310 RepID=A0A9N9E118_9GLOM|nr:14894_t:CDS:2 [Funneliformis caledonium]
MATVSQFFSDENACNLAMKMELASIFEEPLLPMTYGDGVLVTANGVQICYRLIFEGTKELCATNAEPTLQASLYYHGYWSQIDSKKIRDQCCYPSYMLVIAGPWICLLRGIYIDKVIIEPLTDLISLIPKLGDGSQVSQISQFLAALKIAMNRLNNYYRNLQLNYFSTYQDKNNNRIGFKYIHPLTEDIQSPIWKAIANNRSIVINENLQNGFMMIVMDYVDGDPLTTQKINTMSHNNRKIVMKDMEKAVAALHEQNIVFGDLRNLNILVTRKGTILVDFEWCGRHSIDIYPVTMSTEIPWPQGANPGALLMQAHDVHWLQVIKHDLNLLLQ